MLIAEARVLQHQIIYELTKLSNRIRQNEVVTGIETQLMLHEILNNKEHIEYILVLSALLTKRGDRHDNKNVK